MATTTARHRNERLMPHPPAPPENGLGAWSIHGQSGAVARTDRLAFGLLSDDSLGRGTVGGCGVLLALMVMRAVPCPELRERLPRRADPVEGVAYGSPGDDRPSRPRAAPSRREGPPESRVRCDTTARAGRRVYRVWPFLGSSWCSPQGSDVGSQVRTPLLDSVLYQKTSHESHHQGVLVRSWRCRSHAHRLPPARGPLIPSLGCLQAPDGDAVAALP